MAEATGGPDRPVREVVHLALAASGRAAQSPSDGVREMMWATWMQDGQILALKQGMDATIWTFTPESR